MRISCESAQYDLCEENYFNWFSRSSIEPKVWLTVDTV